MPTTNFAWRYPDATSTVDVPRDIKALADDADATVRKVVNVGLSTARPTVYVGGLLFETDTGRLMMGVRVSSVDYWVPMPGTLVMAVRATSVQSIPDGAYTPVTFQAVDYNGFAAWTATTKFQPKFPGYFEMNGGVSFASNVTNTRATVWYKTAAPVNGTMSNQTGTVGTGTANVAKPSAIYCNGTTDYVELFAFQTSGAALSTAAGTAQFQPTMWVKYLGPHLGP